MNIFLSVNLEWVHCFQVPTRSEDWSKFDSPTTRIIHYTIDYLIVDDEDEGV